MSEWTPIEGETPIDDMSGLKVKGVTTRSGLNTLEARNILQATIQYLASRPTAKQAPFDLAWVKRLHQEMFGDVWTWAGQIRTVELNLGSPAYQIETLLQQLLDDLAYWPEAGVDIIEQATRLHHRAVSIHPFLNGNGRWARMLANIWLARNGSPLVHWPTDLDHASEYRQAYLHAIRKADDHDYGDLLELHRRFSTPESS